MSNDETVEGLTEEEQEGQKERTAADLMSDRFVEEAKAAGLGIFVVVSDETEATVSIHLNPRDKSAVAMIEAFPGAIAALANATLQATAAHVKREVLMAERNRADESAKEPSEAVSE